MKVEELLEARYHKEPPPAVIMLVFYQGPSINPGVIDVDTWTDDPSEGVVHLKQARYEKVSLTKGFQKIKQRYEFFLRRLNVAFNDPDTSYMDQFETQMKSYVQKTQNKSGQHYFVKSMETGKETILSYLIFLPAGITITEAKYFRQFDDYSKVVKFTRHGGAYDRGRADSYYRRGHRPHYKDANTGREIRVDNEKSNEYRAYMQGYEDNERDGEHKDWGEY